MTRHEGKGQVKSDGDRWELPPDIPCTAVTWHGSQPGQTLPIAEPPDVQDAVALVRAILLDDPA
jgi:hypothetical protein